MKLRLDFVSNSSSSSYVIITDTGGNVEAGSLARVSLSLPDPDIGTAEFGWQTEKYYGLGPKLNWCALIIDKKRDMEENEGPGGRLKAAVLEPWSCSKAMMELLIGVCAEHGLDVRVHRVGEDDEEEEFSCYIDHQSNMSETPRNARMFKSKKAMEDFLFNDGSYIDNSNDNGGRDSDDCFWDEETNAYSTIPPDYYDVKTWKPKPVPLDYYK